MPRTRRYLLTTRLIGPFLLLATCKLSALAHQSAPQGRPLELLSDDVVTAWREAGAQVGWIGLDENGRLLFFRQSRNAASDMPAFHSVLWREGRIRNLPDPGSTFALDLSGITDAGLKELAGLDSLKGLKLSSRNVTDEGL